MNRATVFALIAMGVAVLVVAQDFTALSVALPAIEQDLHSDLGTVQWTINAYALVFGVLIVTGGRLADMFGRRRAFVAGAATFAAFSVIGGAAPDTTWLIACRALMGVGGALMWPAILGMTYVVLPDSKAGLAGGLILGAAGFGNAVGPLLGGVLTDELSWRWIFFLNLPIAAFAVAATVYAIPRDRGEEQRQPIDYRGIAALSTGLVALLIALDQSSDWGWGDPIVLGLAALCGVLLVAFAFVEWRVGASALVPRDVIGNRNFAAACLTVLLMSAVFFAALLYVPQFETKALGWSALKAGVGLLPMMGTFAAVSFAAGPLYQRVGPKAVVTAGALCCSVGIFLLSRIDLGDRYADLLPALIVLGTGVGLFYSSVTTAGVTALDPSRASLAGGIVYMFQIAGGSVGLGLNTAIVLSDSHGSLGKFVDGIGDAFLIDALLGFAGVVVALLFVGGRFHADALRAHRPHLHRAHPG